MGEAKVIRHCEQCPCAQPRSIVRLGTEIKIVVLTLVGLQASKIHRTYAKKEDRTQEPSGTPISWAGEI